MATKHMRRALPGLCLALTTPVMATGDTTVTEWMPLGSELLGPGESMDDDFLVTNEEGDVLGFEVRFDYDEPISDTSWASDVQVVVDGPGGERFTVGGFTNIDDADALWSFDGPGSDGPGRYGDSGNDIFLPWQATPIGAGTFHVTFTNDWFGDENPNEYDSVSIRFYQTIPAPGVAAVFAAGVVIARRRRRSR
ncbi:MAG: hypothetical protein KJO43_15215 [Phycisphaerae bacterium]|nr:hypothetical protein [Phycisphaerae bacterium]